MANSRSDLMANFLASPQVFNDVHDSHGRVRSKKAILTLAGTEGANHILVVGRFKAEDRILDLKIAAPDFGGAGVTADFGFHAAGDWTAADQAVLDADILADAIALDAAADTVWRSIYGSGAGAVDPPNHGKSIWEICAVATRPPAGTEYDLTMTLTGVVGLLAGSMVVNVLYVAGD